MKSFCILRAAAIAVLVSAGSAQAGVSQLYVQFTPDREAFTVGEVIKATATTDVPTEFIFSLDRISNGQATPVYRRTSWGTWPTLKMDPATMDLPAGSYRLQIQAREKSKKLETLVKNERFTIGTSTTTSTFLTGTAAVGAPMANSTVVVNCAGTTTNITATTDASGRYSISTAHAADAGATLPCAVKVTSGLTEYVSLVLTGTKANVTPLTHLAVARALALAGIGSSPTNWFSSGADLSAVSTNQIANATAAVKIGLEAASAGTATVSFDLFTGTLVPGSASDPYDIWLEAFQTAVGAGYATLVANFAATGAIMGITISL